MIQTSARTTDMLVNGLLEGGLTACYRRSGSDTPSAGVSADTSGGSIDPRVAEALEEYLRSCEAGQVPDRVEFLDRYRNIRDVLANCLDGLDLVRNAATGLQPSSVDVARSERLKPATRLGDFQILREIGRGGMGVVYEAEQLSLGRRVALKALPVAASIDGLALKRFQIEAQAAAALQHKHIVPVYGVGCVDGIHYIAMQQVSGQSLAELIAQLRQREQDACSDSTQDDGSTTLLDPSFLSSSDGQTFFRTVASLGLQAAEALGHAHDVGVLHRDIKPSNLLIDEHLHLWISDFGLARIRDDPGPTRTGDFLGTLRYTSPEQVRGDHNAIGPRSDVYALGATLYELLTLRPRFECEDRQELIHHILNHEPTAPRRINPRIPLDLETIILKAMASEPSHRYASAHDLAEDLSRYLDDRPILARRPNLSEHVVRWSRRHRGMLASSSTLLVFSLVVGSALLWQAKQKTENALASLKIAKKETDKVNESLKANLLGKRLYLERMFVTLDDTIRSQVEHDLASRTQPAGDAERKYLNLIAIYDGAVHPQEGNSPPDELAAKALRRSGLYRMILRDPKGERDFHKAIALYQKEADQKPTWIWIRTGLIETLHVFAEALEFQDRAEEADSVRHRALDVSLGLTRDPNAKPSCYAKAIVLEFHRLAWSLLGSPAVRPEDPARVVELMRWAIDREPENGRFWTALGLALYRDEAWKEARDAFAESIRLQKAAGPYERFLQAMTDKRIGQPDSARRHYDDACRLFDGDPSRSLADTDLQRLRSEAEQLLASATLEPKQRPAPRLPRRLRPNTPINPAS
jgi:serine/threonine protein kinase